MTVAFIIVMVLGIIDIVLYVMKRTSRTDDPPPPEPEPIGPWRLELRPTGAKLRRNGESIRGMAFIAINGSQEVHIPTIVRCARFAVALHV